MLSLEIQPTDPDPSACQTNLRGLIVEERLDNQVFDTSCSSEHRSGSNSHYYTFSLDGEQQVDVRAESDSDDLYLYLLSGSNRDGTILEENDDLPSGQAQGASRTHASGISRTLPAGTYTVEVATDAATPAQGSFMLIVEAPVPDTTTDAVEVEGQGPRTGCPPGKVCQVMLDWPAFTVTYEVDGPEHTSLTDSYTPRELRRLEYTDRKNWRVETIHSEDFYWGNLQVNRTGSWEQQSGRSYMDYDSVTGETFSRTLREGQIIIPNDIFSDSVFWGFDLDTRSDSTAMPHESDVCTADDCHAVPTGTTGQTTPMGRSYTGGLEGVVFTDDQYGIPLMVEGADIDIMELQLLPTTPDPEACDTNLRGLYVSEIITAQKWGDSCNNSEDDRSRAHSYTFTIEEARYVSIRAGSTTDEVLLKLWSGTDKSTLIHENYGMPAAVAGLRGLNQTYHSGIDYELAAGTYTIEVGALTIGNTNGTFQLDIEVSQPEPIAPLPEPVINVELLPNDRWRFSWDNTGTISYIARLSRADGSWRSALFLGRDEIDSIELPVREPFVRHEPYKFRLLLEGDNIIYKGSHDVTIDVIHPEPVATATPTPTPTPTPTATPTPTPTPTPTATPVPLLPNQVRNLSISDTGLVTWDAPTDEVDGYRVLYRKGNPVGWPNRTNLPSSVRTYQIPDFDAGATYSVRVGTLWGSGYLYPESWMTVTR